MKATKLFAFLALCLVLALTGCDSGGGGGGNSNDSGKNYVISDINPKDLITSDIEPVSGGIKFTATGVETTIYDTITLKDDKTFTDKLKIMEDGTTVMNFTFTGTWESDGSSMTLKVKEEREEITGTTQAVTETWTYVVSDDGNTLTKNEAYPASAGWCPTYKKQ